MAVRLIAYYDAKSATGRTRSARADFTVDEFDDAQAKFAAWFQRAFPRDELLGVSWKMWGV